MGVRLLIANDGTISNATVSSWLTCLPGIQIVGLAQSGQIAADLARALHPDVLLIDGEIIRRTGIEIVHRMFEDISGLRILVLSDDADLLPAQTAHQTGIGRRVSRRSSPEDLAKAIRGVAVATAYP